MAMPISTAIVKPVDGLCNLSCAYCYASGLEKPTIKNRMQPETLRATIDFFCRDQEQIEFIWHGGEPLLAGIDFYRQVVEDQCLWKEKGKTISNFVQTNGTFVNHRWADFFAENNFFVGASLDGPKYFHDRVRQYPTKKGSFDDVMRGINLLKKTGTFNGVICGIASHSLKYPREIFNFFMKENIKKLKFARIKELGCCGDVSTLVAAPSQFYDFMTSIFDLWLEVDDSEIEIRDIQSVVNLILGGMQRECIYMGRCDQFATVYKNGSICACDSFPKSDELCFGSVHDESAKVRRNHRLAKFRAILQKREQNCRGCDWHFICKGGCAKDCYANLTSSKPLNEACENLKKYFSHISQRIKDFGLV